MPPLPTLPRLDSATAARFVQVALANVTAEYPFHLTHLMHHGADLAPPRALYPVFWGSYDWHSCVHMHWTLARCLRRQPDAAWADAVAAHFDARLTPAAVAAEQAYLDAGRPGFERPYGWGWVLKLQAELQALAAERPDAAHWRDTLAPLADALVQRFLAWLPRADFAVRAGTHGNTAFALRLALDLHDAPRIDALQAAIGAQARHWFGADRRYPVAYEPSGDDFLSGGLCEALLMRRVLGAAEFASWWAGFAPADDTPWRAPVPVSDPTDAKIVHLHGLNLSRAWCWRGLGDALPPDQAAAAQDAAAAHLAASVPAATDGHYVGTHWLASFALLALDDAGA